MPNYRSHCTINVAAVAAMAFTGAAHGVATLDVLYVAAASFVAATFFLSPDLDLKHSSPTKNWGWLRWTWRPYQMLFRHRGMSHSVLFSSLTRVGYLLGLGVMALAVGHAAFEGPGLRDAGALVIEVGRTHGTHVAAAGAGILLSDLCHIVTDRVVTALRSLFAL